MRRLIPSQKKGTQIKYEICQEKKEKIGFEFRGSALWIRNWIGIPLSYESGQKGKKSMNSSDGEKGERSRPQN